MSNFVIFVSLRAQTDTNPFRFSMYKFVPNLFLFCFYHVMSAYILILDENLDGFDSEMKRSWTEILHFYGNIHFHIYVALVILLQHDITQQGSP